jgi:hypothetical protein
MLVSMVLALGLLGSVQAAFAVCPDATCDADENCGTCPADCKCADGQSCFNNACCAPACTDKECGDNGCGGVCGTCDAGETCTAGKCVCEPNCTGKDCGDNGCGGVCGTCEAGKTCGADFKCKAEVGCSVAGTIACDETKDGDTSKVKNLLAEYSCTGLDETGPDEGWAFTAGTDDTVTVTVDYAPEIDLDIMILDASCTPAGCVDFDDVSVAVEVKKGETYHFVVDGYSGDAGAYSINVKCKSTCKPDCAGKMCGDDGCGGECGACAGECADNVCHEGPGCEATPEVTGCAGCACEACVCAIDAYCCETEWDDWCVGYCVYDCGGCFAPANCGDGACKIEEFENCENCADDCGCPTGQSCFEKVCCTPACDGKVCGDDACGGECGECPEGEACGKDGSECVVPSCEGFCGAGPDVNEDGTEECYCDDACTNYQDCCADICQWCPEALECCEPDCADKGCADDDGCGGTCGCPEGQACVEGVCEEAVECDFCAPWELCVNNECIVPEPVGECQTGGVALSANCGDLSWEGCCAEQELYYCEAGQNCPAGMDTCVCYLNCGDGASECGWTDSFYSCVNPGTAQGDPSGNNPWECDFGGTVESCGDGTCAGTEDCGTCEADCACPAGQACKDGVCEDCTADCTDKVCGDDGCGGSCGACEAGEACTEGKCVCTPDCANKECGDDGCGAACGTCDEGFTCDAAFKCVEGETEEDVTEQQDDVTEQGDGKVIEGDVKEEEPKKKEEDDGCTTSSTGSPMAGFLFFLAIAAMAAIRRFRFNA